MNESTIKGSHGAKRDPRRLIQEQTLTPARQIKVSSTTTARRATMDRSVRIRFKLKNRSAELLDSLRVTRIPAPENFIELVVVGDALSVGTTIRERRHLLQRVRRGGVSHFRIESGHEMVAVLMDNGGLGLRLLSGLRHNRPTNIIELLSGTKVDVDVLTPTVVRLAKFGLVEARYKNLTRTARGNSMFRYLENASGMNLKTLFRDPSVTPEMHNTLLSVLVPARGAAAATATAPALDPLQEKVEEYEDAMKNPNYEKYREEAPWLEEEFGRGFVAYANGKRVAFAEDMDKLLNKVSAMLGKTKVLIQEVPEKVVETSLPFHVVG